MKLKMLDILKRFHIEEEETNDMDDDDDAGMFLFYCFKWWTIHNGTWCNCLSCPLSLYIWMHELFYIFLTTWIWLKHGNQDQFCHLFNRPYDQWKIEINWRCNWLMKVKKIGNHFLFTLLWRRSIYGMCNFSKFCLFPLKVYLCAFTAVSRTKETNGALFSPFVVACWQRRQSKANYIGRLWVS